MKAFHFNIHQKYLIKLFAFLLLVSFESINGQDRSYIDSLEKAFDEAREDTTKFNNLVGQLAYYRLNDIKKSREKVNLLTELANKINNLSFTASSKFHMAVQYRKEGNYDSSIVYYMQAIELYEKMNNENNMASCYGSVGVAYWQLKEYLPSLRYLRMALAISEKKGRKDRIFANLNNIAGVFMEVQKFDSAVLYLKRCYILAEELHDTASMADACGNLGSVQIQMGDTTGAFDLSMKGVEYALKTDYKYQLYTSYSNIGCIYEKRGNYKEAEKYYLMSLAITNELEILEGIRDNYKSLAGVYQKMNEFENAFSYLKQYTKLNDSLINITRMKQFTDLEAKYNTERKSKELLEEKALSRKKSDLAIILSVGLVLVLALAFFAFKGYLNKKQFANEINAANVLLELKSNELAMRNKDVTDSINYAKRIQHAVLPNENSIHRFFKESFIFYKPKDIVSGDFFWFFELNSDEAILVCADCTGHGVPGAFMTVIGSNLLNQTILDNKLTEPTKILSELDKQINFTLKQQINESVSVQDGMDLTLIKVNKKSKTIAVSSAKRPVLFIHENKSQEIKGSKFSLGGMQTGEKHFEEITLNYSSGDTLFMFTDGYADQFGGEKGKKFSSKKLKELLLEIHQFPVSKQKNIITNTIMEWMEKQEQVDDMLVMGIKF